MTILQLVLAINFLGYICNYNLNSHMGQVSCDIGYKQQGILDERISQWNTPLSFD
jgi:hypothetical protein